MEVIIPVCVHTREFQDRLFSRLVYCHQRIAFVSKLGKNDPNLGKEVDHFARFAPRPGDNDPALGKEVSHGHTTEPPGQKTHKHPTPG